MKRHPPEERRESAGPLFDSPPIAVARATGHEAARAAAERAESLDGTWKASAIDAVRVHCMSHIHFVSEDVHIPTPDGADGRCTGPVMKWAERAGLCVPDGYAPTVSSRGSPKVRWRSLIYNPGGRQ